MKWLSPSYWENEGRLSSLKKQREEHTLEWARKMTEFHTWRTCVDMTSKERILWIRGSLGLGKTVMAGYFIELLKCHYPDAIVAYFFCRSGQAGLTKAREIICTLAYQCVQEDEQAQSVLEALRSKDFKIDENVGIGFLFDKLLREPLLKTSKEVFIVLDGLDEADRTSLDCTERRPVTEYEILLAHLGTLKTERVLFISRPEADISRIIPHCIIKQLGRDDNKNDIDRYVRQKIEGSQRLRLHFANESIDPIQYFRNKANGIFLWVEIAIHQLSQAKSSSSFRKDLQEFSAASGSMERLYSSFLNRIEGEDVKWIKEILKWVVVYIADSRPYPFNSFSVDTLKEVVEFTLDDKLPEFQNFLEVEMGSLLHLIPSYDIIHAELIHETLKLFLSCPSVCPPAFLIDEETSHYDALVTCLEVLGDNNLPHIASYAKEGWPFHLEKLSSENIRAVDRIFHFLEGGGCKAWMRPFEATTADYQLFLPRLSLDATLYESKLQKVHTFLMRFKSKLDKAQLVFDGSMSTPAHWIIDMTSNPWKLGEYVGKAAAELCLFQDISQFWVSVYLSLAIKYYCKRSGRHIDSPSDLKDLTLNNFSSIATWSGRSERPPNSNRIGTAFLTLRMWPEAVESLESGEDLDFNIWTWVGHAYMKMNEFEAALRAYKRGIATCPESHLGGVVREELWRYIGLANWTKGDFKSAIEVVEKTRFAHDVQPYNYDLPPSDPTDVSNVPQVYQTQESSREVKISDGYPIMLLASAYAAIGDHHGQLRICLETSQRVNQWWAYQALESAYLSTSNRDYTSTVSDRVSKERAEINHLLHRQNSGHDTTSELGTLSLDWLITGRRRQFSYHYPKPNQKSELI